MPRLPTSKSRMIAALGLILISIGLISNAWLSPPLPKIGAATLGLVAVILMAWAKQVREIDGEKIPPDVVRSGAPLANIEVTASLLCGLMVVGVLAIELTNGSKQMVQISTAIALLTLAASQVVFLFTRRRFDRLMREAEAVGS